MWFGAMILGGLGGFGVFEVESKGFWVLKSAAQA